MTSIGFGWVERILVMSTDEHVLMFFGLIVAGNSPGHVGQLMRNASDQGFIHYTLPSARPFVTPPCEALRFHSLYHCNCITACINLSWL
jgi:hypothetical protein